MLSSLFTFFVISSGGALDAPADWYSSTTVMFHFCVDQNFRHPLCPNLIEGPIRRVSLESALQAPATVLVATRSDESAIDLQNAKEFVKTDMFSSLHEPLGFIDSQSLFHAEILYQIGRAPLVWLMNLKLMQDPAKGVDPKLWARARWLYAKVLYDQRKYKESEVLFGLAVDGMKTHSLFHQERAWAQFYSGKFEESLGSLVSAENPLIHQVPNFDRDFLAALIYRETCNWKEAFHYISKGREVLNAMMHVEDQHPWVILCEREKLGSLCKDLRSWAARTFEKQKADALYSMDLLEVELKDHLAFKKAGDAESEIIWEKYGENWIDELGHYSVPIPTRCL